MATFQLILLLMSAVLVSSVVEQIIPKVSVPLAQIAMGVVIAILAGNRIQIGLSADLFLVVFIAPLLFHEAVNSDKTALWHYKKTFLSYAIGLVVVITLAVGFAVHLMIPSISLAAAFALGAALGPTDAVAVASVSKEAQIPSRQQAILQGESLLNDASGIVSFQFAIAAATTGAFSLLRAVEDFAIEFIGGLLLGLALGLFINWLIHKISDLGLESITFHVTLEVFTPFIVYMLGGILHVSGVIVVVTCGIVMSLSKQHLGPHASRLSIVSSSFWEVFAFALNGVVFVLLGTQLPNAIGNTWSDDGISSFDLVIYIIVIVLIMHGTRLIWSIVSEKLVDRRKRRTRPFKEQMRSALITTLSGAKGTITLAIMFTIPTWVTTGGGMVRFPDRDLLIFLASGVIVVSLLLATYVVPLLAPRVEKKSESQKQDAETSIEILRAVVEDLSAHITPGNRAGVTEVIRQYNDRITRLQNDSDYLEEESDTDVRILVLQWEQEYVWDRIDAGTVPPVEGYQVMNILARGESMLRQEKVRKASLNRQARRVIGSLRAVFHTLREKIPLQEGGKDSGRVRRELQIDALKYGIERMQKEMANSDYASESFSRLIIEYQRAIAALQAKSPSITDITSLEDRAEDVLRPALHLELEQIQLAYDEGRLSRAAAQHMRRNVHMMELDLEDYF